MKVKVGDYVKYESPFTGTVYHGRIVGRARIRYNNMFLFFNTKLGFASVHKEYIIRVYKDRYKKPKSHSLKG